MSFGGGSKQTATAINEPWGPQQPYLLRGFQGAGSLYDQGPMQYYPGRTFAPFSPETESALGMQTSRATTGSPLTRASQLALTGTARGDYLNSNPYLDRMFGGAADAITRRYREAIAPSIGSQFALAGRSGSNSHMTALNQAEDTLSRNLGSLAADIYGGNYTSERTNQLRAAALGPSIASTDYGDIGQLANVGAQRERLAEQGIGENVARFNFGQQAPYDALARYLALIQGNYGSTRTETSPLYRNYGAGALGGALAGSALAKNAPNFLSADYAVPLGALLGAFG